MSRAAVPVTLAVPAMTGLAGFVPFQDKCMAWIAGIACAVESGFLGRSDIRWVAHQRRKAPLQ
eukprot:951801-Pleurochrysis_carterae.AAC.2